VFPDAKRNHYDLRRECSHDPEDGWEKSSLCYEEIEWMETYLNLPDVQAELGVDPGVRFQECNLAITLGYKARGGAVHDSARLLPELIRAGIRFLAYAGTAGMPFHMDCRQVR
jgi:cathepsin A (carboxypeptidase C)